MARMETTTWKGKAAALLIGSCAFALTAVTAAHAADEQITLNYSDTAGPAEAQIAFAKQFSEYAAEMSDGSIKIVVHPGGTLAGYSLEPVRAGIADITQVSPTLAADVLPWISLLEAPYLIESDEHFDNVTARDSVVFKEIEEKMMGDNIKLLGFFNFGVRDLTMKEPVLNPDELSGKRMRVIPSPLWSDMWKNFGAVPVPMPSTETVSAILTNVIEGQENQWHDIIGKGIYDVNKYLMKTEHVVTFAGVWMNAGKWNSMSEDQQTALNDAFDKAKTWFQTEYNPKKLAEYEDFLKDKGVTIVREEDGLDRQAFIDQADQLYVDYKDTWGDWVTTIKDMK
ncbi:TRAP transporter substrate-binding protein [Pseudohoeflea coraliihabitans]|uniref:TRAP transporter substrate-binding protein n=1 Tax=Pseudohoeflea coraliihabitans TaxID=2860393 RepID=A0ABS6WN05_9HYPH|nr:TRAP transporter substrate-binding protein [Pseudohoeflea sp. DP4N28-3]MBW3097053.1 TRAP transporter substrate-binding protein [Pseudohoeflea sp. DP4N28-3]